jgi:hypothetical protein
VDQAGQAGSSGLVRAACSSRPTLPGASRRELLLLDSRRVFIKPSQVDVKRANRTSGTAFQRNPPSPLLDLPTNEVEITQHCGVYHDLTPSIGRGARRRRMHAVVGRRNDALDLPSVWQRVPFVLTVFVRVGVAIATLDNLIVSPRVRA